MAIRTTFACCFALLLILPIFGRSIHQNNIQGYERIVENNIETTLPAGMNMKLYKDLVISYWTPERMASAKPMDLLKIDNSNSLITANYSRRPIGDERTLVRSAVPGVRPKSLTAVPSVVGKVYFTVGTGNYVCSGSVIKSENRDTLLTAGHCVYDTETEQWASAFVFVPDYYHGSTPYGIWVARNVFAFDSWTVYADFNYDVAVALVTTNEGEHIQDITGALGMTKNMPRHADTVSYGYPMNIHDGEEMSSCSGQCAPAQVAQYDGMELPLCEMTGGASGGPWTQDNNYQTSVNSFIMPSRPNIIFGPYFGDSIYSLWEQTQNQ